MIILIIEATTLQGRLKFKVFLLVKRSKCFLLYFCFKKLILNIIFKNFTYACSVYILKIFCKIIIVYYKDYGNCNYNILHSFININKLFTFFINH